MSAARRMAAGAGSAFTAAGARPRTYVGSVGDPNDPATWSGTPFHFLQWGRAAGLLDEGLPLSTSEASWAVRRLVWNGLQGLRGDRLGGYQYSPSFLSHLWQPHESRLHGAVIVNCFQLFSSAIVRDPRVEKWFFIDQTLLQLFDHYGVRQTIGRRVAGEAIEREREGYLAAAGVIAHTPWAATSVRQDYGVPASRIHVAVPGANIDCDAYARWTRTATQRTPGGPLRLVFVGKEWHRKGLDRLLEAFAIARRIGLRGFLRVIGCRREDVPQPWRDVPGVEWIGFIDKRTDIDRFLALVSDADVGCLLSRAEAGGMALREYHALGLAVVGTDAGGARAQAIEEAAIVLATTAGADEIADVLLSLERDIDRLERLRSQAWQRRGEALWSETIRRIADFWPHAHALAS